MTKGEWTRNENLKADRMQRSLYGDAEQRAKELHTHTGVRADRQVRRNASVAVIISRQEKTVGAPARRAEELGGRSALGKDPFKF